MKTKFLCLLGILLLASPVAFAGTACTSGATTGPTIVLANGHRTDFDFIAPSGTNYYQTTLTAGHSYSFEMVLDYDDAATANPVTTTIYKDATCTTVLAGGSATTGFKDTTAVDPVAPLNSFRGSVIASVTGPYSIKLVNGDGVNGRYVAVTVAETTLYSPFFSENPPGHTYWTFGNTTGATINGVLTLTTGGLGYTRNLTVPASGAVGSQSSDVFTPALPSPAGGSARFAHDGPPGAIQTRSTVVAPGYLESLQFGAMRDTQ